MSEYIDETLQTEKMRTRSPLGRISDRSLSMMISLEEAATRCSPIKYGSGGAFGSMYGLVALVCLVTK